MPEMLEYLGRRFVVAARAERACDTHTYEGVRRISDTVILDDMRCDGSGHDGCGARCCIYWKERWLRKVGEPGPSTSVRADPSPELEALVRSATQSEATTDSVVYRCQATELLRASVPVSGWDVASLRREVACGNVRPSRFVRVMGSAVMTDARRFATEAGLRLAEKTARTLGLRNPAGRVRAGRTPEPEKPPPPKGLQLGQLVQIKPYAEIARQLNAANKTRGLYFDSAEMAPHCGRRARVLGRVERFIDEPTGRMVELKSDCYILDGVVCSGDRSDRRWFCPRAIYPWWRESWLSVAAAPGDVPSGQLPRTGDAELVPGE
jgi:hypothetical protein